ncbi:MAG: hypothetical protein COV37_07700 [Bdellovibrio sp. CG11_big_fil_rev_8_21_14_0_20_39_38]|nr:MAG: hypothetical protein COW78_02730 [Bdellovibrio sp. CG22_combo_CG10-13_8_21_14_all_39_27]PIR35607.1 MAG: hypothetical protein COV37_07700 [Bdellovibrio sp. CG11_big_fil_rev_8_21_14_0_20_39_38]
MNKQPVTLLYGRLGKNPELKYTVKSEPVCTLSIAENIEGSASPIWHNVIVWGKQAEDCPVFLKKGSEVFVRGRINIKQNKSKDGTFQKLVEIRAFSIGFTNE